MGREERAAESDDEVECVLNNMGITEELHQYFLEAEKHGEEQRQQPKLDVEQAPGGYVNADHDLYHNHHPSVDQWNPVREAPGHSVRPRRSACMGPVLPRSWPSRLLYS